MYGSQLSQIDLATNKHLCTCMYVCMYMCMHACMHAYLPTCINMYMYMYGPGISIGNHMNSSAIWEIIALSHVLEGRVITRGEAEWNLSF